MGLVWGHCDALCEISRVLLIQTQFSIQEVKINRRSIPLMNWSAREQSKTYPDRLSLIVVELIAVKIYISRDLAVNVARVFFKTHWSDDPPACERSWKEVAAKLRHLSGAEGRDKQLSFCYTKFGSEVEIWRMSCWASAKVTCASGPLELWLGPKSTGF